MQLNWHMRYILAIAGQHKYILFSPWVVVCSIANGLVRPGSFECALGDAGLSAGGGRRDAFQVSRSCLPPCASARFPGE